LIPIVLSMAISRGWGPPVQTVAMFLALELFSNNIMEPWLYGKNTGVSPVAVLVAAIFWSWLWGPVGLLLATPLTVCLLVLGKYVPILSFFDVLLGDTPVFEPKTRVYQRLLAGDQEEAAELVEALVAQMPLVEVYDTVLIPVVASIESHRMQGDLDDGRCKFMVQSLRELVEDQSERQQEASLEPESGEELPLQNGSPAEEIIESAKVCILCLPARNESDDISAMMLAQILDAQSCLVQAVSVASSPAAMVDLVQQLKADVVCISAMPPAAVMHARALAKQLRARFPEINLIVGLWGAQGDMNKAKLRIGGARTTVVRTLAEVQQQIGLLLQPHLLRTAKQSRTDAAAELRAEPQQSILKPHLELGNLMKETH
jgi:hypothetical protein